MNSKHAKTIHQKYETEGVDNQRTHLHPVACCWGGPSVNLVRLVNTRDRRITIILGYH